MRRGHLPMYDWPELAAETERFWTEVAAEMDRRGFPVDPTLARGAGATDDLALTELCGWHWARDYREVMEPVAVAVREGDQPPGRYRSHLIARPGWAGTPSTARVAVNERHSVSGCLALYRHYAERGEPLSQPTEFGSHRAVIAALTTGEADLGAIDMTCWRLAEGLALTKGVVSLGWTDPLPAPFYAVPTGTPPSEQAAWRESLGAAMAAPSLADYRAAFGFSGVVRATAADYEPYLDWAAVE